MRSYQATQSHIHDLNRRMFYEQQERLMSKRAIEAAKQRDFNKVEEIYQEHGLFLLRHPDSTEGDGPIVD